MALYPHLFQNFLQFAVINTVKDFWVVNEAELNVFLEFPCFRYDPTNVGNLISGSSAFYKSVVELEVLSSHTVEALLREF